MNTTYNSQGEVIINSRQTACCDLLFIVVYQKPIYYANNNIFYLHNNTCM